MEFFRDVSNAIDLNSKYDWFKMKLWSKQVSLNSRAKRYNKGIRHRKIANRR